MQRNKYRIHYISLWLSVLLKTLMKITTESHVLLKKIKTPIKICGMSKQNLWFSTTKYL
jgi:hypothetical protein